LVPSSLMDAPRHGLRGRRAVSTATWAGPAGRREGYWRVRAL
jgi:hypothetical protein